MFRNFCQAKYQLGVPTRAHMSCWVSFKVIFMGFTPGGTHVPVWGEFTSLRWRHNDHDSVSNHQPHGCLLNRLFRRRSKKTSKLRVTGLCVGNSPGPVNSPHKGPVTRKMFPFDDVIMWQSVRQMAAACRQIFKIHLPEWIAELCLKCICLRSVSTGPIGNKSALFKKMAWHRTGQTKKAIK